MDVVSISEKFKKLKFASSIFKMYLLSFVKDFYSI